MRFKCFDIDGAYLYGHLEKPLYMEFPGTNHHHQVLKIMKSLWIEDSREDMVRPTTPQFLTEDGWKQSATEPCIYVRKEAILYVYVDDLIVAYQSKEFEMDVFRENMKNKLT
jgi:hypothetical protein